MTRRKLLLLDIATGAVIVVIAAALYLRGFAFLSGVVAGSAGMLLVMNLKVMLALRARARPGKDAAQKFRGS